LIPTGTNDFLTTKQTGAGPTAVALKQMNGWTLGGLLNQIWSVAGSDQRPDVNQMFIQPFAVYNWKSGAGLGGNFEWTKDWTNKTSTIWFNPTISGVTSLGDQKVQLVIGPRLNLESAQGADADMGVRAVVVFLFSK
jgi:hypothetical protein